MPYDAKAVANYFLSLAETRGQQLDALKLQKLVYFAHGWHLAIKDQPLIDEQVEAWSFGPVIRSLYREFRNDGNRPIRSRAMDIDMMKDVETGEIYDRVIEPSVNDGSGDAEFTRSLLNRVWEVYGEYTGIQLSNMTHEPNSPWYKVFYETYGGHPPKGTDIPAEMIRDYFVSIAHSRAAG